MAVPGGSNVVGGDRGLGPVGEQAGAAGLLHDAAHRVRRTRAALDPVIRPVQVDGGIIPVFLGSYVPMISMNLPSRGLRWSATTTL